ncbi:hypothetical protein VHEMI00295 [[Torrubiella] hemipterigena]|uniref:Uncharacterized protein n=1 Tax=[Torrubiella] hemipterigena TaxID=1531966 RepID=A0A0A1T1W3_9HYPO|nr:hypothetical protein VHEMI00295 [[Torrubiella] hemipterigena]
MHSFAPFTLIALASLGEARHGRFILPRQNGQACCPCPANGQAGLQTVTVTEYAQPATITVTHTTTPVSTITYIPPTQETITSKIFVDPVPLSEAPAKITRTRHSTITVTREVGASAQPIEGHEMSSSLTTISYIPPPAVSSSKAPIKACPAPVRPSRATTSSQVVSETSAQLAAQTSSPSASSSSVIKPSTVTYTPPAETPDVLPHSPPRGSYTSINW